MTNNRTIEELQKAFRIEIKDFEKCFNDAISYSVLDEMREKKIADLALSLRKLVIDSRNMTSLATQLDIRKSILFSPICSFSASDYAANIVPVYPLIKTKFNGRHFFCEAFLHNTDSDLKFDLDAWLNEIVIDPKCDIEFKPTRYDVIRVIADKEGGAHYDERHEATYFKIINNYAFEIVEPNGSTIQLSNNCYFETLLSIAFEFIKAMKDYYFVQTLTNKTFFKSDLYLIETSYRINGTLQKYNKYISEQNGTPVQSFCWAFDSNGKASYRLIKTTGVTYFNVLQNKFYQYYLLDYDNTYDLVFLADTSFRTPYMLIKNKSKYSIVTSKEDLKNMDSINKYTFYQAIKTLSKGNEKLFDYSLNKQYVLEDREINKN